MFPLHYLKLINTIKSEESLSNLKLLLFMNAAGCWSPKVVEMETSGSQLYGRLCFSANSAVDSRESNAAGIAAHSILLFCGEKLQSENDRSSRQSEL